MKVGVSTDQAIPRESSGLHISNISNVLTHDMADVGRTMSGSERTWEGVSGALRFALMGCDAYVSRLGTGFVPSSQASWRNARLGQATAELELWDTILRTEKAIVNQCLM